MSERNTTSMSVGEAIRRKGEGRTDWERLRREREQGIEPEIDPDEGEFDWSRARVVMPSRKIPISVRLDDDVLAFFKTQGRGGTRRGSTRCCVAIWKRKSRSR